MEIVYRPILKKALKITWRYKFLWLLGLFAAVLGNGGSFDMVIKNYNMIEDFGVYWPEFVSNLKNISFYLPTISDVTWQNASNIILSFLILILLIAIFVFSIVFKSSLLYSSRKLINEDMEGKKDLKAEHKLFHKSIDRGFQVFWKSFALHVFLSFVLAVVFLVIGMPFAMLYTASASSPALIAILVVLAVFVFVFLALVFAFMMRYALIYVVTEDNLSVHESITKSWRLFKRNWLSSIEMAVILFAINVLIGFLVFIPINVFFITTLAFSTSETLSVNMFLVMIIFVFVINAFVGALLNVFQNVSWVGFFDKIDKGPIMSRLHRIFYKEKEKKEV